MRCTSGIQMTAQEFRQIVGHLRTVETARAIRVLEQEKEVSWFEEIMREACLFYDVRHRGCLIYPVRPLVCRLFGRVEWLPCPVGKLVRQIDDPLAIIDVYVKEPRRTFTEWQIETGMFDLRVMLRKPENGS